MKWKDPPSVGGTIPLDPGEMCGVRNCEASWVLLLLVDLM